MEPSAPDPAPPPQGARRVASTKRRGRMTDGKRAVLAALGPRLGLDLDDRPLGTRLTAAFGRVAPRLLDVGIGSGEATVAWARAHPDHDVVAVELHPPSLVAALAAVDESGLANLRVAEADVRVLLDRAEPGDVDHMRLLFPDPWPKRRHHHRRLVDAALLVQLGQVVPAGGTFHLATDWEGYAAEVRALLGEDPCWTVLAGPSPTRPITPYERIGLDAGRPITDLVARRR
ncbi:MAG: tRNA (guanosine(46)-N7)-methyltransferase TrmB [Iamia sp.]